MSLAEAQDCRSFGTAANTKDHRADLRRARADLPAFRLAGPILPVSRHTSEPGQ